MLSFNLNIDLDFNFTQISQIPQILKKTGKTPGEEVALRALMLNCQETARKRAFADLFTTYHHSSRITSSSGKNTVLLRFTEKSSGKKHVKDVSLNVHNCGYFTFYRRKM